METVRASSEEVAIQVLLENLSSSPFIPEAQRNYLAELVLMGQWDEIRRAMQCLALPPPPVPSAPPQPVPSGSLFGAGCGGSDSGAPQAAEQAEAEAFAQFRAMVVAIFSRSSKVCSIAAARRRMLGAAIHRTATREQLKALTFSSLEVGGCACVGACKWPVPQPLLFLPPSCSSHYSNCHGPLTLWHAAAVLCACCADCGRGPLLPPADGHLVRRRRPAAGGQRRARRQVEGGGKWCVAECRRVRVRLAALS